MNILKADIKAAFECADLAAIKKSLRHVNALHIIYTNHNIVTVKNTSKRALIDLLVYICYSTTLLDQYLYVNIMHYTTLSMCKLIYEEYELDIDLFNRHLFTCNVDSYKYLYQIYKPCELIYHINHFHSIYDDIDILEYCINNIITSKYIYCTYDPTNIIDAFTSIDSQI